MFAKYAIGAATIGIQVSEQDNESSSDVESTGIGISVINDDLSVSFGKILERKPDLATKKHCCWCIIHNGITSIALSMNQETTLITLEAMTEKVINLV